MAGGRNLVARLEGILRESGTGFLMRVTEFGAPMFYIAFVVRDIKEKPTMRIGPDPFGDNALNGDHFLRVISDACPVMSKQRRAGKGHRGQDQRIECGLDSHEVTSGIATFLAHKRAAIQRLS